MVGRKTRGLVLPLLCVIAMFVFLVAAGIGGDFRWGTAYPTRPTIGPSQVVLTISTDKEVYAIGELPTLRATLTNNAGKPIDYVRALDGSDRGRSPQV